MPIPDNAAAPVKATSSLSANIILTRVGRIFENKKDTSAKAAVA